MAANKRSLSLAATLAAVLLLRPAPAQTDWQKYLLNPVMVKDTTLPGIWEWAAIGQPSCIFEDDTIKMYYAAAGVAFVGDTIVRGRISYAHTTDGITWTKRNPPTPVLNVGSPGAWDSRWLDTPAIVRDPAGYKLYYYGDSLSVAYSAIGMASSVDGFAWTKHPSNPVLERGELLGFDGFWIESPAVLHDSAAGIYEMWYTGVGYGPGLPSDLWISIGRATSIDGAVWIKDSLHNPVLNISPAGSWDDGWVSVPAVRKTGAEYEMWYIGVSIADYAADSVLDTARVGYATSADGINWTRHPGNPVLSTFDPPVDTGGPWAPDVVFDGVQYQMFYETVKGIGRATAAAGSIFDDGPGTTVALNLYPNPFSEKMIIRFTLHGSPSTNCDIKIYDVSGRLVKSFAPETSIPNRGAVVVWSGDDDSGMKVPAGVYHIRVPASGQAVTRHCIKIK